MTVCQSYLGQMQPPCEDQMLVAGQDKGSDDSDSEDDQFTEGNRDSIGNFLAATRSCGGGGGQQQFR